MPNERPPTKKLPDWYTPPHSITHTLKDTDTWETVAAQFHLNAKELIKFNFHTNIPEEVNFYLRTRTGCKVPSPTGFNWRFSSPKNSNPKAPFPGIIHIPIQVITMDGEDLEGSAGVEEDPGEGIDEWFSHHGLHLLHKILDGVEWGELGATAFEIALPEIVEGFLVFAGPVVTIAALGMSLGMGVMDALDQIKTDQAIWGLSYGVVLGAGQVSKSFLKMHGFLVRPVRNVQFPEQEKNFDLAYKRGLAAGYAFGKKLNSAQRGAFFKKLRSYLGMKAPDYEKWTAAEAERYYRTLGPAFRRYMLKM